MITNLDNNLSTPHQKIGDNYGCELDDTDSIVINDKYIFWYDRTNEGFILSDYRSATDISDLEDKDGRKYGVKSYFIKKTQFISKWNLSVDKSKRFDVVCGIDVTRKNVLVTFRPRRGNSNDVNSYINTRRNLDVRQQETLVYNITTGRWTRMEGFTPEGYGKVRGRFTGVEMVAFAAGKPYYHNNTGNQSYLNFFGVQTEPVLMASVNDSPDIVKVFQSLSLNILPNCFYIDLVYSNEQYGFSYVPGSYFKKKQNVFYAGFLRDMVSYPNTSKDELFRSMLVDGKKLFGRYIVIRFVGNPNQLNEYFQLSELSYLYTDSPNNTK
jgi:hypothetical protein